MEAFKKPEHSKEYQSLRKNISEVIQNLTEAQTKDIDVIMYLMMIDPIYMAYADDSLKQDKEFGLMIAENFPFFIHSLDPILAQDEEIVLRSIEHGNHLRNIKKELRTSSDIIKAYDKRTADMISDREDAKSIDLNRP